MSFPKNHSMSGTVSFSPFAFVTETPIILELAMASLIESKSVRSDVESRKSDERCLRMKSMSLRFGSHAPNSPLSFSWPIPTLSDLRSERWAPYVPVFETFIAWNLSVAERASLAQSLSCSMP